MGWDHLSPRESAVRESVSHAQAQGSVINHVVPDWRGSASDSLQGAPGFTGWCWLKQKRSKGYTFTMSTLWVMVWTSFVALLLQNRHCHSFGSIF